jgi:hypothetical protein
MDLLTPMQMFEYLPVLWYVVAHNPFQTLLLHKLFKGFLLFWPIMLPLHDTLFRAIASSAVQLLSNDA